MQRQHRKTVKGRGNELEPLDEDEVLRIARELKESGVESLAICFLFSYLNPEHERRAKELVRGIMPEAFITTFRDFPQFREFERFTTAALASFVGPKVAKYVKNLENSLSQNNITGDLRIMASNGGVITPRMVLQNPALTMMSGLAAGVLGGAWVGEKCERSKVITFDIGGTSADIGIAIDGKCSETESIDLYCRFPTFNAYARYSHNLPGEVLLLI